jgi:RND family efflux transporter MFP subunit
LVDRGAVVKAGQALATLDETDWKLQLQQAEAALSSAQATRDQAVAERDRIAALRQRGWSTNSDIDKANAAADQAIGNRDQAAKAVTLAQNALSYATLVADAAGVVTSTPAEPGQVVSAGQAVIGLAHDDAREADVSVPETLIDEARQGTATVALWSRPDKVYQGRLRELTPSADTATRTYPARFSIENAGSEVALGMTATVTLSAPSPAVARLPLGAILDQGHGPTVFVIDPATKEITSRPVTVASYEAEDAIVASGLTEGETVVALGVQKLHPGETVRLASADD